MVPSFGEIQHMLRYSYRFCVVPDVVVFRLVSGSDILRLNHNHRTDCGRPFGAKNRTINYG